MSEIVYTKLGSPSVGKSKVILSHSLQDVNYLEADDIKKNVITNENGTYVSMCTTNFMGRFFMVRNAELTGICREHELEDMIDRVEYIISKIVLEKLKER